MKSKAFGSDKGSALLGVLMWSIGLVSLSLVVAAAAIQMIQSSDHSSRTFDALAAAEAGLEDYQARLQANDLYYLTADPSNLALTGWAPVPGGT